MRRWGKTKQTSGDVLDACHAARLLGAHVETVRRLARRGGIPGYKVGKDWRFSKKMLREWQDTHHARVRQPLVLIVDDDQGICRMTSLFLETEGYRVTIAENGLRALESMRQERPDIVLLDLMIPGMSSVEALKEFDSVDPDLPVIITTDHLDSRLIAGALRYPPIMLLAKPINKDILLKTVRLALYGKGGVKGIRTNKAARP